MNKTNDDDDIDFISNDQIEKLAKRLVKKSLADGLLINTSKLL